MKKYFALGLSLFTLLSSTAVFGAERPTADKFPDKTIIIGTHAIALNSLTQELLEISLKSGEDNQQDKIYFKSDINKGTWYDITDSEDISEISVTTDNVVTNDTINNIDLTHYTNESGETVEFSSGKQVRVSSLNDLSDPADMPELDAVKNERNILNSIKENMDSDEDSDDDDDTEDVYDQKISSIDRVMKKITGPSIDEINRKIGAMENFISDMQGDGSISKEMISIAVDEKMKMEEERDALCYQTVVDRINHENKILDYAQCKDLIDLYADVITSLEQNISETGLDDIKTDFPKDETESESSADENNSDTDSEIYESEFTKKLNESAEKMIKAAETGNINAAKDALTKAYALETAMSGDSNVSDEIKQVQLEQLNDLRSSAESEFTKALEEASDNQEYKTALQDGSTQAVIDKIMADTAENIADKAAEMISLDDKINERTENLSDIDDNLAETKQIIKNAMNNISGDFKEAVNKALKSKIDDIDDKIVKNKLNSLPEYVSLKEQVEDLKEQVRALDESYIGAVEEDSPNSESIKNQLDDAVKKLYDAQEDLNNFESDVRSEVSGDADTSGEGSFAEDAGESIEQAAGEPQSIGEDGMSGNTAAAQQNTAAVNTADSSSENNESQELADQKNKYTQAEKNKIAAALDSLGKGYEAPWKLIFQNRNVKLTSPIVMQGNMIYVPAKELAVQLGLQVIGNSKANSNTVIIKGSGGLIEYTLGDTTIYINDKRYSYKPAPTVYYGGKAYIPLECFEKAFGLKETALEDYTLVY